MSTPWWHVQVKLVISDTAPRIRPWHFAVENVRRGFRASSIDTLCSYSLSLATHTHSTKHARIERCAALGDEDGMSRKSRVTVSPCPHPVSARGRGGAAQRRQTRKLPSSLTCLHSFASRPSVAAPLSLGFSCSVLPWSRLKQRVGS